MKKVEQLHIFINIRIKNKVNKMENEKLLRKIELQELKIKILALICLMILSSIIIYIGSIIISQIATGILVILTIFLVLNLIKIVQQ